MMAIVPVGTRAHGPGSPLAAEGVGWRARVVSHPTLLLGPLLVLLLVVFLVFPDRQDDEAGYLELARNIVHGHYAAGRPDALLDADRSYPDLWFGPGLPLALAGLVAVDLPTELLRLTGPIFLFAALLVFFALARRTMSTAASLVATWALALYVPFYTLLPNLHSEPLALLFVVVSLYATARLVDEGRNRWLALGAVALAGLALTRVDYGWVLTLALMAIAVWWLATRRPAAKQVALMYALALALCVPWLAYTSAETGRFFQWGNSGSLSLYWMSSPYDGDLGDWQQASAVFTEPGLTPHRPFFESLRGLEPPEQNARLEREALANIRSHPVAYAQNVVANVSRLFFDAPYSRTPQRLTALYFALPNALLLAAALLAAIVAVRVRASLPGAAVPFAIFGVTAFGLHVFVSAYPRMLMPVVPVIAWFVATALANHVRLVAAPPPARAEHRR